MSTAQTARAPSPATLPRHRGDPPRRLVPWLIDHRAQILTMIAVVAIAAGALLHLIGAGSTGKAVWGAAVALLAAELSFEVGRSIIVERSLGVDTIALVAMVGSLALNQELAGAVIGLMFSSGAALETIASRRARRELTALIQRAPKVAQLRVDGQLQEVAVEQVQIGDVVVVRAGGNPGRRNPRQSPGCRGHEHPQRRTAPGEHYAGHAGVEWRG